MYKYQNLKIESLGSWVHVFLINDAWKTQVHVNMNVIKHKVVAGSLQEVVSLHSY